MSTSRFNPVAEDIRNAFSLPQDIAFFNCAYLSPLLKSAVNAGRRGIDMRSRPWQIDTSDFYADVDRARVLFADIVHTCADNIAIVPAASYGFATVCRNITLRGERRDIILIENEHPSSVLQWREKAERERGTLRVMPLDELRTSVDPLCEAIDERTAVVSIAPCHWVDGTLFDIKQVARACRKMGAILVVDGTQSVGVMDFEFDDIQPDYLVVAGYKWLFGPYSVSFLAVHPSQQHGHPIELSKYNYGQPAAGFDWMQDELKYPTRQPDNARRFDMGEKANFCVMPMVNTALQWVRDWGPEAIAERIGTMSRNLIERAAPFGLVPLSAGNHAPHLFGLTTAAPHLALLDSLRYHHVYMTYHKNIWRVSPHLYNTARDVETFATALLVASEKAG